MREKLLFLISKVFLKNLALAVGIILTLLIIVFSGLSIYTRHGDYYSVPDLKGLTEVQFTKLIEQKDLRYLVIDSVHINQLVPGAVVEQTPKAGSMVKKQRTIFLTINALTPEKVPLPRLTDYSLRNAQVVLQSYGLKTGRLIFVPSEYTNLVLGQHYKGKPIETGTLVMKGAEIDLLIGKGLSSEVTSVPYLKGLTIDQAKTYLQSIAINLGTIAFDTTIVTSMDSSKAIIWRQSPESGNQSQLHLGASVDVWVSLDSVLIGLKDSTEIIPDITDDSEMFE